MINRIFKNYEIFYNMVLSTTIMSNSRCEQLSLDSEKIIDFIGKAYDLDEDFIKDCAFVIINDLSRLGKTTDQLAVYANRQIDDSYTDEDSLFDIKGDVLATLQQISELEKHKFSAYRGWFDYSHYKSYQPDIRYSKIYIMSSSGNLISTRQVGILNALGIGCEQSYDSAITRLLQCARWGDVPSMHYLAYVYKLKGDEVNYKLFKELSDLSEKYLRTGVTVLPEKENEKYSEEARNYYACISTILQDIVQFHDLSKINFSFLEAVFTNSLDHYARMDYINHYKELAWRNLTNSSIKPPQKLGFKN